MSKLQNDFTTPEQSKRLLELGVPADSADFFWFDERNIFFLKDKLYSDEAKDDEFVRATDYAPCWSVGRLIEIMKICNHPDDVDQVFCELAYSKKNLVELIIRLMEENKEITDFSKLEE